MGYHFIPFLTNPTWKFPWYHHGHAVGLSLLYINMMKISEDGQCCGSNQSKLYPCNYNKLLLGTKEGWTLLTKTHEVRHANSKFLQRTNYDVDQILSLWSCHLENGTKGKQERHMLSTGQQGNHMIIQKSMRVCSRVHLDAVHMDYLRSPRKSMLAWDFLLYLQMHWKNKWSTTGLSRQIGSP